MFVRGYVENYLQMIFINKILDIYKDH